MHLRAKVCSGFNLFLHNSTLPNPPTPNTPINSKSSNFTSSSEDLVFFFGISMVATLIVLEDELREFWLDVRDNDVTSPVSMYS